jgi:hypothetical protein
MLYPGPPFPPGFQLPGIRFFLVICAIIFCFIGIALYVALTRSPAIEAAKIASSPEDDDKNKDRAAP